MVEKNWHPNFIKYMDYIVKHNNYNGLPIKRKNDNSYAWIATKKSDIGKKRIDWALTKANCFNIVNKNEVGIFAKVMYELHPTKEKVCQICGRTMSIKYIYPNKNFIEFLNKNYNYAYNVFDTIYDINVYLQKNNISEENIKRIYINKMKFELEKINLSLNNLMELVELECRNGNGKLCGPGAMSNFPDRYDGFHSYNRCCRSVQDKGRHVDNLKTYNKDRRAYEYWSDGNIHAANKFMGTSFFKNTSADHIGPISLGFIHDPRFLQPMLLGDNSAKRDRLTKEDFYELKKLENEYNICPVSWFAKEIWNKMKSKNNIDLDLYRDILKNNMNNFMYCLFFILEHANNQGKIFLEFFYIIPKMEYFLYNYEFERNGNFLTTKRNVTDATKREFERFKKIAFSSIYNYQNKSNRNLKVSSFNSISNDLNILIDSIKSDPKDLKNKQLFETIIIKMQHILL